MPTRDAPEFRPRGYHDQAARQRRKRLFLAGGALAAVIVGLVFVGVFALTSGDDDAPLGAVSTAVSRSTGGSADSNQPLLAGPASRFVPKLENLRPRTKAYPPDTYTMNALSWASTGLFASPSEGEKRATELGFTDGFKGTYQPDGQLAGVLQGGWYTTVEIALFADQGKASQAYDIYESLYRTTGGSIQEVPKRLGNQSSGWSVVKGTVGSSETAAVYHRFVFRRGNMVAMVQTMGAQQFMSIDQARDTAVLIDEAAIGHLPAFTPTPDKPATVPARP